MPRLMIFENFFKTKTKLNSILGILLILFFLAAIPIMSESTLESTYGTIKNVDKEFISSNENIISSESTFSSNIAGANSSSIFSDVAITSGIDFQHFRSNDLFSLGAGVAILDINKDNLLDIYLTNSNGSNALYRNDGGMNFSNIAVSAGVDDPLGNANGVCAGDYDNDGNIDLFLANYGTSKLFQNLGNETFSDVTSLAQVEDADSSFRSMGCAFGDYNQDSYLDLMVVRYLHDLPIGGNHTLNIFGGDRGISYTDSVRTLSLFTNNGNGTFTDDAPLLGDANPGPAYRAGFNPVFFDYDNDGDLDIHTCNDFDGEIGPNVLWQNNGPVMNGWNFTDVSQAAGIEVTDYCMGSVVGDYDNNGFLDLYHPDGGPNNLLRNIDGIFTDTTDAAGVGRDPPPNSNVTNIGWGGMFFDHDNDGDLDLYFVAGLLDHNISNNFQPNGFFENNSDLTFDDISSQSGTDDDGIGRGGAFGDFNNDGCVDMFVGNLGTFDSIPGVPGEPHTIPGIPKLYQNNCSSENNWITIKTAGTISNADGIGARVKVTTTNGEQIREVTSGGSHISQNMLPVHFGLANATQLDIEINWPSGENQTLTNITPNQILTVVESEGAFQICVVPPSGDWIITQDCTLTSDAMITGDVLVQNNSVLTIDLGVTATITSGSKFDIQSGSGILIKNGTLQINS